MTSGMTDTDNYFNPKDPMASELIRAAQAEHNALMPFVAPLGKLSKSIPERLDKIRVDHGIPDAAFNTAPTFDRCFIWQIGSRSEQTFTPGGILVMPDAQFVREKRETPRGILIAAGLTAMDQLLSHGIEIGDVVLTTKLAPYHAPIGYIGGQERYVIVLAAGDIVGSEDLATRLKEGTATIAVKSYRDETTRAMVHVHTMSGLQPQDPDLDPDY